MFLDGEGKIFPLFHVSLLQLEFVCLRFCVCDRGQRYFYFNCSLSVQDSVYEREKGKGYFLLCWLCRVFSCSNLRVKLMRKNFHVC